MSLCVQLELKNRKVLIVGGGHVALRKTKLFLREGAKVTIVASDILKELYALAQCHKRAFTQDDVLDAFLVVAASNDAEVNGKVRQAAQQANVLFMNVEADSQSHVLYRGCLLCSCLHYQREFPLLCKTGLRIV